MYGKNASLNNGLSNNTFLQDIVPVYKKDFYNFQYELMINNEIVYSNHPSLKKFKNSKILIIGGGGSVNNFIDFNTIESEYDFIWSLNSFFNHPKIKNIQIDLCSFGPDNIPAIDGQLEYLDQFNPLVFIEYHYKWYGGSDRTKIIKYLNEEFYNLNYLIFGQVKFYSMVGAGIRLLVLACALGASELSFIGFDGYQAIVDGDHAFEPGKAKLPSRCKLYGNAAGAMKQWAYEYELFWHYIKEKFPETHIISIDKANPYHQAV